MPDPNTNSNDRGTALVLGASGYVGGNLVPYLLQQGWHVRAAARNPAVLEARDWEGVDVVQADALDPASLKQALAGADVAFYLVHSMASGAEFGRLDLQAAEIFAEAAATSSLQRIVYLGGLVPGDEAGEHIDSRRQTGEILRRGSVPVTEIRAGIIVGPGSAAFEVMRDLTLNLPVMLTPRWVRATSPPIALHNLLVYLEAVSRAEEAAGKVYDAGGPEICSYEDMMRAMADAVGKRAPIILPVPVLTPRLSSYWLGLTTAVPANIARALIGGLKHDFTADDAALKALVPQQLMTVRESIDDAIATERRRDVAVRWTEGNFAMRGFRHDVAYYAKRAEGSAVSRADPAAVWAQVVGLGDKNRYYYMNFLWTLREFIDWCVGGPGLTRGRRHPTELRLGDTVDYWTVVGVEPGRRLTLNLGMRAPGAGVLEFEIEPLPDGGTQVTETAYWHPRGVWGLLYWYALLPSLLLVFRGMTGAITRRAEWASQNHRV